MGGGWVDTGKLTVSEALAELLVAVQTASGGCLQALVAGVGSVMCAELRGDGPLPATWTTGPSHPLTRALQANAHAQDAVLLTLDALLRTVEARCGAALLCARSFCAHFHTLRHPPVTDRDVRGAGADRGGRPGRPGVNATAAVPVQRVMSTMAPFALHILLEAAPPAPRATFQTNRCGLIVCRYYVI